MEQLNKTPVTGKFGDVAKVLDTNFGLIVTKLMELSKAKKMNCGFYSSETELKTAYPNPDKGMMAYVGSGTDYTVYRCKTDGTWTATSETFKVNISVDFSTYATKDALAQVKGSVDSLLLGAVYGGIAARTTNPGTPKTKVFYLPTEVGEYYNFGNLSVVENEIAFLYYDGTNWTKQSVDFSNNFDDINNKLSDLTEESARVYGELDKKANAADVDSKFAEESKRVDAEIAKKANAEEVDSSLKELQNTVFPLQVSLSLDKTLLEFTGNNQTVKASYSIKRKDVAITPTSLALSINGVMKDIDIKTSDTISIEVNKEGESTLVLTAKHDDLVKSATNKVTMVLPIYYGFGTTETDIAIAANKLSPRLSASGTYTKTSTKDNVNFIILVPKTLPGLSLFTMGGAPFVMITSSVVINSHDYYMYKSGGIYMSGTNVKVQAS